MGTTIAPTDDGTALDALLARAEALRDAPPDAAALAEGLAAAQAAWSAATPADAALRLRAGRLRLHFLYRSGRMSASVDAALALLPLLEEDAAPERVDLLRQAATCAVDTHRFEIALATAQQAHREAQALADPGRLSLVTNTLGCFFERIGDPWQAERLLDEAVAIARPLAEPRPLFVALNNLAAVLIGMHYLLRDAVPAEEARAPLLRARPALAQAHGLAQAMPDPFARVFVTGNLGEVLVHLGEFDAAQALLDEAAALARQGGFGAQVPRIACSQGELALGRGDAAAAQALLAPLLAHLAVADQPATRLRLHQALGRAAQALGDSTLALQHLQQALRLERERAVAQLRAQSQLLVTRVEVEQARRDAERETVRAEELEAVAHRDPLTGLANRRELARRWPELLRHAAAAGLPLAVAMVDVDHFKAVNDRHGHGVGDRVLGALAQLMRGATRAGDLVVRMGGEEFLIVLPDTPPERALEVCERLRRQVAAHAWAHLAQGLAVTLSVGVAASPPLDATALTAGADAALYLAKAQGRDRVVLQAAEDRERG